MVIFVIGHVFRTMLEPISQSHIAMGQINGICPLELGGHRVLLRQDQAHDFTKLDVIDEKLHVNGVGRELGRPVRLILKEVVFVNHFDIRVFRINTHRATQGDCNRSVS